MEKKSKHQSSVLPRANPTSAELQNKTQPTNQLLLYIYLPDLCFVIVVLFVFYNNVEVSRLLLLHNTIYSVKYRRHLGESPREPQNVSRYGPTTLRGIRRCQTKTFYRCIIIINYYYYYYYRLILSTSYCIKRRKKNKRTNKVNLVHHLYT